jgi:hypothetical protein
VAVSILAFWLVMMALLIRREVLIPRLAGQSFQASAVPDAPQESWMGIYLPDGQKVGFLRATSKPDLRDGEEGALLGLFVVMRTKILGETMPVKVDGTAWASATSGLRDFDFTVRSGEHEAKIKAGIKDRKIDATFEVAGESFPLEWTFDEDLFLWSGMGASNVYFPAMEEGDQFLIDAFDPITLSKSAVVIRCVGSEVLEIGGDSYDAKVIDMEFSTMTTRAHIDPASGQVLRAETPLGITLQRISPGEAADGLLDTEAADLFGLTAVNAAGLTPTTGARRMVARISGIDAWSGIPVNDTQRLIEGESDIYEIVVPSAPSDFGVLETPDGMVAPWQRVQQLVQRISAEPAIGPLDPPADLLTASTGGATEKAVRFAQIANGVGLEARVIAGLVWAGEDTGFRYHVWPEVFLGRWYWVDPTLGQAPADALHIQLAESPDEWPQLIRQLPSLQIEVLEVE